MTITFSSLIIRQYICSLKWIDSTFKKDLKIATATAYKALDILVARKVVSKVVTEKNIIRYDAITKPHHYLHSVSSDVIKDYENDEIIKILEKYFNKNKIRNFDIEEIKIQIIGKFKNDNT